MRKPSAFLLSLAIAITLPAIGPVQARADIVPPLGLEALNYNVTLQNGIQGVTDIVFLEQLSSGNGVTWPYSLTAGSSTASALWPLSFPAIVATAAVGLATGVPGDPSPTLVVFGNFSSSQIGQSFSTLFPDLDETSLIAFLETVSDPQGIPGGVVASTLKPTILDAESLGIMIAPNSSFDAVAFSNGQLIGTGTMDITNPAPEPSSLSLLLLGISAATGLRLVQRPRATC
jgi:hypothetical protein